MCFVLAEEILWAGDHKTADKLKSMITAPTPIRSSASVEPSAKYQIGCNDYDDQP